jgi:ubiquinol-cytochrome c reductase cytochrome c subunit
MRKHSVVAALLIAGMAIGVRTALRRRRRCRGAGSAAVPPGNAVNGRKLFVSFGCYQCHGYEAQGSSATGPRLGPRPIPFANFTRYVRRPTNQMPPFTAKVVSDAELTDVYAFLRSLPMPADVASIPL